ncbi:hypothetical protein QYF36_013872 [Acer negundo]|nr:hypothetical protein QYF36_013872 [Acer negundo]
MCYGNQRSLSPDPLTSSGNRRSPVINALVVEDLRGRLAETEARLERARAREAELSRRLEEMKRFIEYRFSSPGLVKLRKHCSFWVAVVFGMQPEL